MGTFTYHSLGCKVNQYDGDHAAAQLEQLGLAPVDHDADVILVSTCAVTNRAAQKARQLLRRRRAESPRARVVLTGCMSPSDLAGYRRIAPDLIVLPHEGSAPTAAALAVPSSPRADEVAAPTASVPTRTRVYVKVQDGCDLKCSYCIIPSIRGRSRSRAIAEIAYEVGRQLALGHREVILCGVHLGHWGREQGSDLATLVDALLTAHPGDWRLRLSSLEVTELSEPLLALMVSDPRVVPHLHLPLQSGSDAVLRQMRRPYTSERFLRAVARARERLSDPAITTDVIVGFPGETDADFAATLAVVRTCGFAKIHLFPFSAREGTGATRLGGRVAPAALAARKEALLSLERELRRTWHSRQIGTVVRGLVEHAPGGDWREATGERYQKVVFRAPAGLRGFVSLRVVEDLGERLRGEVVQDG